MITDFKIANFEYLSILIDKSMLQRIQSFWYLLAAACTFLTLNFAFFSGVNITDKAFHELTAKENNIILILTVANGIGILIVALFLFKNRKLQFRINLLCIVLSILIIALYFLQVKNYSQGSYTLWAIFSFAVPVFLIMAARGVYKDEKLVKSLDRLR
jgi:hypothetical protein